MTESQTRNLLAQGPRTAAPTAALTRRHFLALGVAGLAAQWLPFPLRAMSSSESGLPLRTDEPLSVGYLLGSNDLDRLDLLPWEHDIARWQWPIIPAASPHSHEQPLTASRVKITVHGLYPHVTSGDEIRVLPQMAQLLVHYTSPHLGEHACVHHAWGMSRRPTLSVGHRVSIVAPVHPELGLPLTLQLEESATSLIKRIAAQRSNSTRQLLRRATLTADSSDLHPGLQRGIYFLGLTSGAFEQAAETVRPGAQVPSRLRSLVISVESAEIV